MFYNQHEPQNKSTLQTTARSFYHRTHCTGDSNQDFFQIKFLVLPTVLWRYSPLHKCRIDFASFRSTLMKESHLDANSHSRANKRLPVSLVHASIIPEPVAGNFGSCHMYEMTKDLLSLDITTWHRKMIHCFDIRQDDNISTSQSILEWTSYVLNQRQLAWASWQCCSWPTSFVMSVKTP